MHHLPSWLYVPQSDIQSHQVPGRPVHSGQRRRHRLYELSCRIRVSQYSGGCRGLQFWLLLSGKGQAVHPVSIRLLLCLHNREPCRLRHRGLFECGRNRVYIVSCRLLLHVNRKCGNVCYRLLLCCWEWHVHPVPSWFLLRQSFNHHTCGLCLRQVLLCHLHCLYRLSQWLGVPQSGWF